MPEDGRTKVRLANTELVLPCPALHSSTRSEDGLRIKRR
jgi:hypothetical protein